MWAGVFLGVAGLIAAPILVYFALHPDHFFIRSNQLLILQPDQSQGDPLGAFLGNVWEHLLAFGFRGDPNWRHNFAGHPMLNPREAFFFWFGAGMPCGTGNVPPIVCCFSGWRSCSCRPSWPGISSSPTRCA